LQQIITQLQEQNKELEKDKKLLKNELKEWKLMLDKK
jgi:hypothetical protein